MKTKILKIAILALLSSSPGYSQNYFPTSGNVGVNTGSLPSYPFEVNTDINFTPVYSAARNIFGKANDVGICIYSNTNNSDGARIDLNSWGNTSGSDKYRGSTVINSIGPWNDNARYAFELRNLDPWATPANDRSLLKITKIGNMYLTGDFYFDAVYGRATKIFGQANDYGIEINGNTGNNDGARVDINSWGNTNGGGFLRGATVVRSIGPWNDYSTSALEVTNRDPWATPAIERSLLKVFKNGNMSLTGDFYFAAASGRATKIFGNANDYGIEINGNTDNNDGARVDINSWGNTNGGGFLRGATVVRSVGPWNDYSTSAFEITNHDPWATPTIDRSLLKVFKNGNMSLTGDFYFAETYGRATKIFGNANDYGIEINGNTSNNDGARIDINSWGNTAGGGFYRGATVVRSVGPVNDNSAYAFEIANHDPWAPAPVDRSLIKVFKNGQMVIGNDIVTPLPDWPLLAVQGGILTERVRVALKNTGDWSDFVFANDYKLKSLNEVENFVKKNKHLPDVPSAQEVVNNGIDLGAMDAKLLQKIEELTLYMIQQQKEIDALKKQLNK